MSLLGGALLYLFKKLYCAYMVSSLVWRVLFNFLFLGKGLLNSRAMVACEILKGKKTDILKLKTKIFIHESFEFSSPEKGFEAFYLI